MENQDDGLGIYKDVFEVIQDYCQKLKEIEEDIANQYNNLKDKNQKINQKAYLINMKDYNKFKEQIEYNTFINNMNGYKNVMIMKLVSQESKNLNKNSSNEKLKEKLKLTKVDSIKELYTLLKQGQEYILINKTKELSEKIIGNINERIYSYSINSNELSLNIDYEDLSFAHNKNIINSKVLKNQESEIFPNANYINEGNTITGNDESLNNNINNNNSLEEYEKLTDWLVKFILKEEEFKLALKTVKKEKDKEKEKYHGYLIEYQTYEDWEKNLQLTSLKSVIKQYINKDKKELSNEEKKQIIKFIKEHNISNKNHIKSIKFDSIEKLKAFNKVNNLIFLNKELFLLINDDEENNNNENQIEYEISEKSIDIFINNEKANFLKFENIICSYLYNNLCLLTKIYIYKQNFYKEKKPSTIYLFNEEFFQKYKESFQYNNLLLFLQNTNFNIKNNDKEIFDFVANCPEHFINSIKEKIDSFKFEIKSISPSKLLTNNNLKFAYFNAFDEIFLSGGLYINLCNIHSLSQEKKNLRKTVKFFFINEKLLILFLHEENSFGQIGNINESKDKNIFDIDYLISVKENKAESKGSALLNDILKFEEDYKKFYNDIYDLTKDVCFEYKASDKLILNVLNFKKYKDNKNSLNQQNPIIEINNNQIQPQQMIDKNNNNNEPNNQYNNIIIQDNQNNNNNVQPGQNINNVTNNQFNNNIIQDEQNNNNNIQNNQNININETNNNNFKLNPFFTGHQQNNGNNKNTNFNDNNSIGSTKVILNEMKGFGMNTIIDENTKENNNNYINPTPNPTQNQNLNFEVNYENNNNINNNINNFKNMNNINNNVNINIYNFNNNNDMTNNKTNNMNDMAQMPNNNFNYQNQIQQTQQTYDFNRIKNYLLLVISFIKSDQMIKMNMNRINNISGNYRENLYLVNKNWIENFCQIFDVNDIYNIINSNQNFLSCNDNNMIIDNFLGMLPDNIKNYLNCLDYNDIIGKLNPNYLMNIDQQFVYVNGGNRKVLCNFNFVSEDFLNVLGTFFNNDIKGFLIRTECVLINKKIFAFTDDNAIYIVYLGANYVFFIETIIYFTNYQIKSEIMNMVQAEGIGCLNFLLFSGELIQNNFNIQILNITHDSIKNNSIIQKLKAYVYFDIFNKKLSQGIKGNNTSQEEVVIINKDLFNKIGYWSIMNIINNYIQNLGLDQLNDQKQIIPSLIANLHVNDIELLKQSFSQIHFSNLNKHDILLEPQSIKSSDNKNISVYNNFIAVKKDIIKIFLYTDNIAEKYVKKLIIGNGIYIIVINNNDEKTLLLGNIMSNENAFQLNFIFNYKYSHDLEHALDKIKNNYWDYITNYLIFGDEEYIVSPIFDSHDMIVGYGYRYNDSFLYNSFDEYYLSDNLKNVILLFNYYKFLNNKLQSWDNKNNKITLSSTEYCIVNKKWLERFKKTFKYDNITTEIESGKELENISKRNDKNIFDSTDKNIYFTLKSFNADTFSKYNKELKEINLEKESDLVAEMETISYIDGMSSEQHYIWIFKDFEILPKKLMSHYLDNNDQNGNFIDCKIIDSFIFINFPKDNEKYITLIAELDAFSNSLNIKSVLVYYNHFHFNEILEKENHNIHKIIEYTDKRYMLPIIKNNEETYVHCCIFKYVPNSMNFNNGLDNTNNNNNLNNIYNYDGSNNDNGFYNDNDNNNNDGNNNQNELIKVDIAEYNLDFLPNYPYIINNFNYPPLIGLDNIGATCYMNATLQCFSNIGQFVNFFKYDQTLINNVRNEIKYNTQYTLSSSFKLLIEKLWPNDYLYNQKKSYSPYEFKAKISVMNELFRGVAANDSKDLVNFIIMTLHDELNLVKNKINDTNINLDQRNMQLMYNTFTQNFNANNQSEISRLFYAYNYNMTQCQNCKTCSYNFQTYFFLIFPLEEIRKYKLNLNQMNNFNNIVDNNIVNIYDCLDYERKNNIMDGTNMMYCNYCRVTCNSIMSTHLCTGPEILIIILNRGKGIQFNVKINFFEQLDLSNYIGMPQTGCFYSLIGVITHIGESGMGGHFIAYCKNPINNLWNKYNDSMVSPVTNFQSDVIDFAMPYLLFYQKNH